MLIRVHGESGRLHNFSLLGAGTSGGLLLRIAHEFVALIGLYVTHLIWNLFVSLFLSLCLSFSVSL